MAWHTMMSAGQAELAQRVEASRWRALVDAAPVVVVRLRGGSWEVESATDGEAHPGSVEVVRALRDRGDVAEAVASRHARTVRWELKGAAPPRHFTTQVTPLPDGDVLT